MDSRLPPLFPPTSPQSSSSRSRRIGPGAVILPPPSLSLRPSFHHSPPPSLPSSQLGNTTPFPLSLSSLSHDRLGAQTVPPPQTSRPGSSRAPSTSSTITSRTIVCLPCRRGHLKCGKGMRPCLQCIKKGKPEDCLEGMSPEQAELFMQRYCAREALAAQTAASASTSTAKPVSDSTPMLPLFSEASMPGGTSLAMPSLPWTPRPPPSYSASDDMDCDLTSRRVLMVLGMDLRIYRVSPDSSRMLGWQPHEMLNLHLVHFFPVFERTKWETFSSQLFTPMTPPGAPLHITAAELATVPWSVLMTPVANMRSIVENFQFRQSDKKLVPVKVELWYRSCFGATVDSWSTFSKAIILAKIKEVAPPAVQDLSNTDPYMPYFPSVLRPVPSTSTSTLQDVGPPARRRRASSLSGSSTLPTLPSLSCAFGGTLPPLPSSLSMSGNDLQPLQHPAPGGNIASLPPLPGLHTPSRKRRTSTTSFLHPNPFESTSDASIWPSSSRPRLRSNLNGDPLPFPSPFEAPHFPPIPRPLSRNRR